jgi:hypothetical protein
MDFIPQSVFLVAHGTSGSSAWARPYRCKNLIDSSINITTVSQTVSTSRQKEEANPSRGGYEYNEANPRQLWKIFLAANRHDDAFVNLSVLEAWRIRVIAMPPAPHDYCEEAPFFIPFSSAQLADPY